FLPVFFSDRPRTVLSTLSLHDALPICLRAWRRPTPCSCRISRAFASFPGTVGARRGPTARPAREGSWRGSSATSATRTGDRSRRSEEHTSELQSRVDLVCRLLLEKKKK